MAGIQAIHRRWVKNTQQIAKAMGWPWPASSESE
jgi:hypothetical protein